MRRRGGGGGKSICRLIYLGTVGCWQAAKGAHAHEDTGALLQPELRTARQPRTHPLLPCPAATMPYVYGVFGGGRARVCGAFELKTGARVA